MSIDSIEHILLLAKKKHQIDQQIDWSGGSSTYLSELRGELDEVNEEILLNRGCYLEDELGDVLWDYLNLLVCLENEKKVNIDNVLVRAHIKYNERVVALEAGNTWSEIKVKQKLRLEKEYQTELCKK